MSGRWYDGGFPTIDTWSSCKQLCSIYTLYSGHFVLIKLRCKNITVQCETQEDINCNHLLHTASISDSWTCALCTLGARTLEPVP